MWCSINILGKEEKREPETGAGREGGREEGRITAGGTYSKHTAIASSVAVKIAPRITRKPQQELSHSSHPPLYS